MAASAIRRVTWAWDDEDVSAARNMPHPESATGTATKVTARRIGRMGATPGIIGNYIVHRTCGLCKKCVAVRHFGLEDLTRVWGWTGCPPAVTTDRLARLLRPSAHLAAHSVRQLQSDDTGEYEAHAEEARQTGGVAVEQDAINKRSCRADAGPHRI